MKWRVYYASTCNHQTVLCFKEKKTTLLEPDFLQSLSYEESQQSKMYVSMTGRRSRQVGYDYFYSKTDFGHI